MTQLNPYTQLGVAEDASFEEIQQAKARLFIQYSGDPQILESIEAAYDAVLMDCLRLRQTGKIKIPDGIRFPEQAIQTMTKPLVVVDAKSPAWLVRCLDNPSRQEVLASVGVFLPLSVFTLLPGNPTLLPLIMALGCGCSLYFLNRKENKFGRSVLLSLGGLILGLTLGSLLSGLVPHPMYFNPDNFIALMTLLIVWLVSTFLK